MPLLRRQHFDIDKPPPDLDPEEEVFHCKITNEIFRDYEEFFERTILCNSLVWSCSVTGRCGLTYEEAEECEEKARKNLASFPNYLQRPILYLASLTHRSRLADMNDDVFVFCKDHYFIGEMVEVHHNQNKKSVKIVRICLPTPKAQRTPTPSSSIEEFAKEAVSPKPRVVTSAQLQYVVQEDGKNCTIIVKASKVSRRKGLYTRDKSKLFLKQNCESVEGTWTVKEKMVTKHNLGSLKFEDFSAGPPPIFVVTQKKKHGKNMNSSNTSIGSTDTSTHEEPAKKKKKQKEPKVPAVPELSMEEKIKQHFLEMEERKFIAEQQKAERLFIKEQIRQNLLDEKVKRKEERAKEREKQMEEKKIQALHMKEWSKPRDDMECDDLKVLPDPVPIQTLLSVDLFGEAVMILEFIHVFQAILELKEYFPNGLSLNVLENALTESDVNGPLVDLLEMLLAAVFHLQDEEEDEEIEFEKDANHNALDLLDEDFMMSDVSMNQLIMQAAIAAQIPQICHRTPIKKLHMDGFTITEILRMHFLSSGAKASTINAKFRYQQRGGYSPLDDPGLEFKMNDSIIMKALSTECIFDMTPGDKIKVISALMNQFMTYATARDFLEDNFEKLKIIRMDLKQLQWAEQRREREEAAARYKRRQEERARERIKMAERREKKLKEKEVAMAADSNNTSLGDTSQTANPQGDESVTKSVDTSISDGSQPSVISKDSQPDLNGSQEKMEEIDNDMSPEEREAARVKQETIDAERKAEYIEKEADLMKTIMQLQHGNAICPLGRDRLYRRYWVFQSLPGLYVEDNEINVNDKALIPVPQHHNSKATDVNNSPLKQLAMRQKDEDRGTGSDKENESFDGQMNNNSMNKGVKAPVDIIVIDSDEDDEVTLNTSNDTKPQIVYSPAESQILDRKGAQWSFIRTVDQLEELINSLNSRGHREGALKQILLEHKTQIIQSLGDCNVNLLHMSSEVLEEIREKMQNSKYHTKSSSTKKIKHSSTQEYLELNLCEMLLDIEERLYAGSLAVVNVKDRIAWRIALDSGKYDPQTDDPLFARAETVKEEPMEDDSSSISSDGNESTIKDFAKALVQIAQSIDAKYLSTPLGEDEKTKLAKQKALIEAARARDDQKRNLKDDQKKNRKRETEENESVESEDEEKEEKAPMKPVLERWKESLLLSTNVSQVYLHLSTLEQSICWSKSALHARCRICRRKGDAEKMLLCDGCDRGHHMYCLKPQVKHVPTGDWFCPTCKPKERASPRKGRHRTFSEEASESEKEEDSDEEEESSDEDEEEEDENDNLCVICRKDGMLICCDQCPLSYHLACARPPLKKVPRGKWVCQVCTGAETKAAKVKLIKGKKPTPGRSTPSGSRPGSRRESPRDSPVNVKQSRKRHNSDSDKDDTPKIRKTAAKTSRHSLDNDTEGRSMKHYSSSSRCNSKVQQMKACEDLVNEMIKMDDSWPFMKPVSKKLVPDYYDLVKNPMDFSGIRNRINKYEYSDAIVIVNDVRQIFINCEQYNRKGTQEFKAGSNLSKFFEKKVKDLHLNDSQDPNPRQGKKMKKL